MRIAVFHELHQGGARRSVNEFSRQFKKKHQIDLFLVDAKQDTIEKKYFNQSYFFQFVEKSWKGDNWKVRLYKDTVELVKLYLLHRKIAHRIDQRKYDIIFVHPSKFTQAPFVLRFLKSKTAYYCQEPLRMVYDDTFTLSKELSFFSFCYEKVTRYIRKLIDLKNISGVSLILCNSQFSARTIRKAYGKGSVVCYLGVDSSFFKKINTKKINDVLFVGSKDRVDGFNFFEKAREYFPFGTNTLTIESFAKRVSDAELVKIYNQSKIVIALAINEPFGLIPLEAMACGTPVIAVAEGGYMESVIDGKTGYLVSRNEKALAERVSYLLKNEKEREQMGENARLEMQKNWTWDKSARKIERVFLRVL